MLSHVKNLQPSCYIEILDILKEKAKSMESEIEKTVKIESPSEARTECMTEFSGTF